MNLRVILPPIAFCFAFLAALYFQRARQWKGWTTFHREQRLCYCAASISAVIAAAVMVWWYLNLQANAP